MNDEQFRQLLQELQLIRKGFYAVIGLLAVLAVVFGVGLIARLAHWF